MIQLIVLFSWKDSVTADQVEQFKAALAGIASITSGLREYRFGTNLLASPDGGDDLAIIGLFDDSAAVEAWIKHPDHVVVTRNFTEPLVSARHVVQFEVAAS